MKDLLSIPYVLTPWNTRCRRNRQITLNEVNFRLLTSTMTNQLLHNWKQFHYFPKNGKMSSIQNIDLDSGNIFAAGYIGHCPVSGGHCCSWLLQLHPNHWTVWGTDGDEYFWQLWRQPYGQWCSRQLQHDLRWLWRQMLQEAASQTNHLSQTFTQNYHTRGDEMPFGL